MRLLFGFAISILNADKISIYCSDKLDILIGFPFLVAALPKAELSDLCPQGFHKYFFQNSHLIRRIQQKYFYKKIADVTWDWTEITCLAVGHLNHYTRMFSVLV